MKFLNLENEIFHYKKRKPRELARYAGIHVTRQLFETNCPRGHFLEKTKNRFWICSRGVFVPFVSFGQGAYDGQIY